MLTGSYFEPSLTLKLTKDQVYKIEVKETSGEIVLQMLTTDGSFY